MTRSQLHAPSKIDVHQHVLPPVWVDEVRGRGTSVRLPDWSPEAALEAMDDQGISKGILSLSDPGVLPWPGTERAAIARRVNEYVAELTSARPDRFGSFATVPLPDVRAAVSESAYALDVLRADGVVLFTNYDDIYVGDPAFEPLWDVLDEGAATVFIHPTAPALASLPGVPPAMADFPFSTTRAALQLVMNGTLERHPNVRVILSHAGGFLPYTAYRFAMGGSTVPGSHTSDDLLALMRRFYLDTALSSGPTTIPSLLAFADLTHVVFGSDYPYAAGQSGDFSAMFDTSPLLSDEQRVAIAQLNAAALLREEEP